jgi:hypothetical protein
MGHQALCHKIFRHFLFDQLRQLCDRWVEALFAELKNQIGLRRLRLRRLRFVREQFFVAAVAQNLKRLVRFLRQTKTPVLPATT